MAKNKGFASLAALQSKIQSDEPVSTEELTQKENVVVDPFADEIPVDETQSEGSTIEVKETIEPAQPIFDELEETTEPTTKILGETEPSTWTIEELEAYIAGRVDEEIYLNVLKAAVSEHRVRESTLSKAWSINECREYLSKGLLPAKTSKGAWVNDVTRKFRREYEWETNELESWALGEIKAEGTTIDSGLAIELKQRLNLQLPSVDVNAVITNYRHNSGQVTAPRLEVRPEPQTPTVTENREAEVTKQIQLEGLTPVNQSYIESSLAKFEAAMKPGRAINETISGEAQKLLRTVMVYAISIQDPVGARSAMQYLLDYFRERRAVGQLFEDTYAFRGIPDMRTTKKEQVAHHDLLTLFLVYADPMVELRQQTDTPSLIGGVPSHLQSRVLEFFSRV